MHPILSGKNVGNRTPIPSENVKNHPEIPSDFVKKYLTVGTPASENTYCGFVVTVKTYPLPGTHLTALLYLRGRGQS